MIRYHPGMTRGALVRTHKSEHIGGNKPTPTEKGAAIMHDLQSPSTPKLPFTYLTAHSSQAVPWASRAGPRASNTCFPQNVIQTLKQPQRPKCSYTPKLPSTWLPIATTNESPQKLSSACLSSHSVTRVHAPECHCSLQDPLPT